MNYLTGHNPGELLNSFEAGTAIELRQLSKLLTFFSSSATIASSTIM